jgi:hypothetical protein
MTRFQNFSRLTKTIPFSIAYRFFTFSSVPHNLSSLFCKYFTSWGESEERKMYDEGENDADGESEEKLLGGKTRLAKRR